jgi:hypothetical protein
MEISPLKSKVMAFKGHVPIRSKPVIDNTILEQIIRSHTWDDKFHTKRNNTQL